MDGYDAIDYRQWIPLFPLPQVVLLPKTILPLHIFEPRYRAMMKDAWAGSQVIAIALLKPGVESLYHALEAPIHDWVGVGRIIKGERLPDGRYNCVLQGIDRALICDEDTGCAYRRGRLKKGTSIPPAPEEEIIIRKRVLNYLARPALRRLMDETRWLRIMNQPTINLSDLLDTLASAQMISTKLKQQLLEEPQVTRRARLLCETFQEICEEPLPTEPLFCLTRSWPPRYSEN